jgi:inner membrane protein
VLALALWPFVLAGGMVLLDRGRRRFRRWSTAPTPSPRALLLLAAVSVLSHPILDSLNTYGVRWLMPFSGRWFYGDALFIVDPWLWLTLGTGVLLSRRRAGPARVALACGALYAVVVAASGIAARRVTARELSRAGDYPGRLMLSPMPVTPLVRSVVAARDDAYLVGRFRWLERPELAPESLRAFPRGDREHPAVVAASATELGRRFLTWARFPAFRVEPAGRGHVLVHIMDLRYADRPGVGFGAVSIPVTIE